MTHYEVRISCDVGGCTNAVTGNGFSKPSAALEHAIKTAEQASWYYSEGCWICFACNRKQSMPLVPVDPCVNRDGDLCGICDGTYAREHPYMKCTVCGQSGLAENMDNHVCKPLATTP